MAIAHAGLDANCAASSTDPPAPTLKLQRHLVVVMERYRMIVVVIVAVMQLALWVTTASSLITCSARRP